MLFIFPQLNEVKQDEAHSFKHKEQSYYKDKKTK